MADVTATLLPGSTAAKPLKWPTLYGGFFRGCLRDVQLRPLPTYRQAWQTYGDYVRIRALPGIYFYLLAHPAAIEHVLQDNHKNYRKPDSFNNSIRPLSGNGIIASEGPFWRKQRRLMQPAFLRQNVLRLGSHMVDAIDDLACRWERTAVEQVIDILPEMMRLGLRIASTALFSTDVSGEADSIGQAYRNAFEYVSLKMNGRIRTPLWIPTAANRQFRRSMKVLDRVVLELIARRRGAPPENDVLELLLAAQDEESGTGMTDGQLRDEAITLLTAGHETAGAALSWAWYLLAEHPKVQQSLHDEVRGRLRGSPPTADDLPHLPLATAVFEESMRLYPPAWGMPRESIEPDTIGGYPLPAKATLILAQCIAHRHPDYWPEPNKFDPLRFMSPPSNQRPKFAYFPFGGGPRLCIGIHFAMIEGPLVLATLAQRFQFTLVSGQSIVEDPTFTLRPKPGVKLMLRRRSETR